MRMPILKVAPGFRAFWLGFAALFFSLSAPDGYPRDITNRFDFDGDGKADISVYREGGSTAAGGPRSDHAYTPSVWYYLVSSTPDPGDFVGIGWGRTLDVPIPADFHGDNKTDAVIFRWFEPYEIPFDVNHVWIEPLSGPVWAFGTANARKFGRNFMPEAGPNQKAELGELQRATDPACPAAAPYIYTFYYQTNSTGGLAGQRTNVPADQCAAYEQVPVPDDYNGDGKSEIAVFNTSDGCYHVWGLDPNQPTALSTPACFGPGFVPAPGYYDTDERADYAAVKTSENDEDLVWHIRYATSPGTLTPVSVPDSAGGTPVAADYVGDARTDFAFVRPDGNNWQWRIHPCSGCSVTISNFGFVTDLPLPRPYFYDPWY